jgi:hypothetical protein
VCESKLRALLAELTAMRAADPTSKVGEENRVVDFYS